MSPNTLFEPFCDSFAQLLLIYLGAVVVIIMAGAPDLSSMRQENKFRVETAGVSDTEFKVENGPGVEFGPALADKPHTEESSRIAISLKERPFRNSASGQEQVSPPRGFERFDSPRKVPAG
jgi:hypothetical protein